MIIKCTEVELLLSRKSSDQLRFALPFHEIAHFVLRTDMKQNGKLVQNFEP